MYTSKSNLTKLYTTLILLYPMLLSLDSLAATPFAPFRVKLLLLHAGEALHLSNGSLPSLVQTLVLLSVARDVFKLHPQGLHKG